MSSRDEEPFDWFNKFFGKWGEKAHGFGFPDIFRGFGEMRREMEREFQDVLKDIQAKAPKDLVREYETKEGEKVKENLRRVYAKYLERQDKQLLASYFLTKLMQ